MSQSRTDREGRSLWVPRGIVGFPGLTRFRLFTNGEENLFHLLQSEEKSHVRFSLIDPLILRPDFRLSLTPDQLEELEVSVAGDLESYLIVTVPDDARRMTVNFRAPFLVSRTSMVGMQVLLDDPELPVRAPLAEEWARENAEMAG